MNENENVYNMLRQRGCRLTSQTKAILDIFLGNKDRMLSVADVAGQLPEERRIDNATVYRNIRKFLDLGIVESMNDEHGINRFALSEREHHHYLICTQCGSIVRFPCSNHYWNKYAKQNGFAETHHKLEVYGRCEKCAKK